MRHRAVEEAWHIIAGTGRVWRCPPNTDPGSCSPVAVTPGDAVVIPVGWAFQFSADLHEELRFLCVTMPPWPARRRSHRRRNRRLGGAYPLAAVANALHRRWLAGSS